MMSSLGVVCVNKEWSCIGWASGVLKPTTSCDEQVTEIRVNYTSVWRVKLPDDIHCCLQTSRSHHGNDVTHVDLCCCVRAFYTTHQLGLSYWLDWRKEVTDYLWRRKKSKKTNCGIEPKTLNNSQEVRSLRQGDPCSVQCTNVVPHAVISRVKYATKSKSDYYWLY